ncbi:hypothetical protein MUK42_04702 [Musa troglodytarum]|uniref:Uncharacterized protein n=1 Tax=Musa troglodytarum TaxID=320322 RepID=A0A9E7GCU3_9LILI|nr:hypothetical protein MUK42_04702 [Musa troglodytarum]
MDDSNNPSGTAPHQNSTEGRRGGVGDKAMGRSARVRAGATRSMAKAASPCPFGSRSRLVPSDASPLQHHPPPTLAFLPTSPSMNPLSASQIRKPNARIGAGATRKRSTLPPADVSFLRKKQTSDPLFFLRFLVNHKPLRQRRRTNRRSIDRLEDSLLLAHKTKTTSSPSSFLDVHLSVAA